MYVVGATLLSDFWTTHPRSHGELAALHALLAATPADGLSAALGRIAALDSAGATVELRTARVRVEISPAAGVARYASIEAIEEESP
ncbi:MAG TPA: hypothetical protein VF727_06140 [Allosphingosinicella sp.]|jgi:hypothetical protein